jgi:hypothetical protein
MACEPRQRTGTCNHSQCPYPDETTHGYNCVDIEPKTRHYPKEAPDPACEVGENCLPRCSYSWQTEPKERDGNPCGYIEPF